MMNRRAVGLAYAVVTPTLLVANWATFANPKYETLAVWAAVCALLCLSQVAFLVIAARMKYRAVIVMASGVLVAVAAFIYIVSHMAS